MSSQMEQFGSTMAKIMNCFKTGIEFTFTKDDAIAIMNAGKTVMDAGEPKPDFPDFIGEDAPTSGEHKPENFPVSLPQPVIQEEIEPYRVKPILTILKSKSLESLVENVNKFNHSQGIQIISTSPIQKIDEEFIKEIIYFDYETNN